MLVSEVVDIVDEWVDTYGKQSEGFCGAHFLGSINKMGRNDEFPLNTDVDISVLIDKRENTERPDLPYEGLLQNNDELYYKKLLLEIVYIKSEMYSSHGSVLSNPTLAHELTPESIISDPEGRLNKLSKAVIKEFNRREWVIARCEAQKNLIINFLNNISDAVPTNDCAFMLGWNGKFLATMIALASLEPPTHRRSLIKYREQLKTLKLEGLYEELLEVMGYAHLTREKVNHYFDNMAEMFDRAVEVKRSPCPFGFKIKKHLRPYIIDATKEMIDEGNFRETMFWIKTVVYVSNLALQNDAPEEERVHFQNINDSLTNELGLKTAEHINTRKKDFSDYANIIFKVTREIIDSNPKIVA